MLSGEDNPFEAINGIWKWRSEEEPERDEFMHIGQDGRVVSFVYVHPQKDRKLAMRLWMTHIEDDDYEARLAPGSDSWRVKIYMTETGLGIVNPIRTHDLKPVQKSEVPGWFGPMLDEAWEKMDKEEESIE